MSKVQVVVLAILGLIACGVTVAAGLVFYNFSTRQPVAQAPPPAPTPAPTATPTITPAIAPLELPTSSAQDTEPTPTNTPVVGATLSPTPGQSFGQQLTGHTREPGQAQGDDESGTTSGVDVRFWADNTSLQAGSCTNLHWQVEGVSAYWIDGQPGAGPTGELHICPSSNEAHVLKYDESVNGLLRSKEIVVTISVSARPESSSGGGSGSGGGGGSSGGGSSGNAVAEFSTANGDKGYGPLPGPYSIIITIYDDNEVSIIWSGCSTGYGSTQLRGNEIEFKKGNSGQAPYFFVSATWDKNKDTISGRTEMLDAVEGTATICAIDDVFIMR